MRRDQTDISPRPEPERVSDAAPIESETHRRPGEALFAVLLTLASAVLLWQAYGISGFDALSGAGSVPMATTLVMLVTAGLVLWRTLKLPLQRAESVGRDILPPVVLIMAVLLVLYALVLRPLGFLPTSALFLIVAIKLLSRRSWGFTVTVALGSLLLVWVIFRIVFTVLMPQGIVPEGELLQLLRNLVSGGSA
ncbi:tripartite tricarboxylate transporter TctB family protein [Roseivivax sp. CAU 1761]